MFWVFVTLISSVLSLASVDMPQQETTINPGFGIHLVVETASADSFAVTFQGRDYHLRNEPIIGADDVAHAGVAYDQSSGTPVIQFEIKPDGADRLETVTANNVGRMLCVTIKTHVVSCATIQGIFGERFQTAFNSMAEAHNTYSQIVVAHDSAHASDNNLLQLFAP